MAVALLPGAGEHEIQFAFLPQHQLFFQAALCLIVSSIWKHWNSPNVIKKVDFRC